MNDKIEIKLSIEEKYRLYGLGARLVSVMSFLLKNEMCLDVPKGKDTEFESIEESIMICSVFLEGMIEIINECKSKNSQLNQSTKKE